MQVINGIVIQKPDAKTVVVEVVRKTAHPLYRKLLKRSKTFAVDNNGRDLVIGTPVSFVKTRPISKRKHFQLVKEEK